eukprot:6621148-Alexandrium_andersonii.AAC.2
MNYNGGSPLASVGNNVCHVPTWKDPAGQLFLLMGLLEARNVPVYRSINLFDPSFPACAAEAPNIPGNRFPRRNHSRFGPTTGLLKRGRPLEPRRRGNVACRWP